MSRLNLGIVHPGEMGISVAATIQNSGHTVHWVSEGRSQQTRLRAAEYGLLDAENLEQLCEICSVIISVCPPHAAEEVADQIAAHSFKGLYLDANAISPQRSIRISRAMEKAGAAFVDGGIIGKAGPDPGSRRIYLSGQDAEKAAAYFSAGPFEACVIGDSIGKASALKMCTSAYSKGSRALLGAILALADGHDVRTELQQHWSLSSSDFVGKTSESVKKATAKAWRFVGEMQEVSETFTATGLPGDFHNAAAVIYRRLSHFKNASATVTLEEVLEALLQSED